MFIIIVLANPAASSGEPSLRARRSQCARAIECNIIDPFPPVKQQIGKRASIAGEWSFTYLCYPCLPENFTLKLLEEESMVDLVVGPDAYRELPLLGQNVNSYEWANRIHKLAFEHFLEKVAKIDPLLRVRFATSHPKDMSDDLLKVIAANPNLCKAIHLPVQSGSTAVLERINPKPPGFSPQYSYNHRKIIAFPVVKG